MKTLTPRLHILPEAQQRLWPLLRDVTELGFVLFGGTAVALRLGHRASVDFDFFTKEAVDPFSLRTRLPRILENAITLQSEPNTLTVSARPFGHSESVKVSFFGELPWVLRDRASVTDDGVLRVASLQDLLATKLVVIQKRVEVKDYLDIAAMLGAGAPLHDGVERARQMYGAAFQPAESLKAMVYFQEGDFSALSAKDRSILIGAARTFGATGHS